MPLNVKTSSVLPSKTPYGPGIGNAARQVRLWKLPGVDDVAKGFEALLNRVDGIDKTLRNESPTVSEIVVTDSAGRVIAALGDTIYQGVPYTNYFSEIHAGDPLMTRNPAQAVFNANADGSVTIGEHGWLDVLDPYDSSAAWIGTQFDVQDVIGATASPTTPLIRLEITAHTLATGDVVRVLNVGGVPNATGIRTVTKIDANHVDLQSTVFVGTYTSGGTVDRLLHVTGAANNGSGLIRLTVTAHGYESGDKVNVQSVGGVSNATGQWIITVVTANTFDLEGSTFAGAYTSGGTSLRYFAGGLFQTFAIGDSFVNYKLRAFADGTLRIQDAAITVTYLGPPVVTVTIDPSQGGITITDTSSIAASNTMLANSIDIKANAGGDLSEAQIGLSPGLSLLFMYDVGGAAAWGYDTINGLVLRDPAGAVVVTIDRVGNAVFNAVESSTIYSVLGDQVVGPRLAAIAAPTITTSNTASTAGATYTATEQGMLNALKTSVGQLNTDVTNLQSAVNTIRARLAIATGHGLTA